MINRNLRGSLIKMGFNLLTILCNAMQRNLDQLKLMKE